MAGTTKQDEDERRDTGREQKEGYKDIGPNVGSGSGHRVGDLCRHQISVTGSKEPNVGENRLQ